jgi:hypothetical protein
VILLRLLRGLVGAVAWLLAAVLALVSLLLCVTLILLPLGIPLLGVARRLFGFGVRMMTSRKVSHPVDELRKAATADH